MTADPVEQAMVHLFSSHLLRAAMKLGLPDVIGDEPMPVEEIARRTATRPDALRRLLRALSTVHIFRDMGGSRFAHTPVSRTLRSSDAGQLIGQAVTDEDMWAAWAGLGDAIRTDECPFTMVHGESFYSRLGSASSAQAQAFHAAMQETTDPDNGDLLDVLDLSEAKRIVDVGGGRGGLLRDILRHNEHLHGVLFDIESVVGDPVPQLLSGDLSGRCDVVAGDARESVPADADVYVLRYVLHNWDDEACVRILSRCVEAARPGTRVVVIERLLAEDGTMSALDAMADMGMFVTFGSRERGESDFVRLFERAGLTYRGATPLSSLYLLEAAVTEPA